MHAVAGGYVVSIFDLVHDAGWSTGLDGKWHLRSTPRGFDQWAILPGGGGPWFDPPMTANCVNLRMRGHSDDVVGDQAIEFLRTRPVDRPFLLLMNFKSPHRNWYPAKRFEQVFDDVEIPLPRTYEDRLDSDALRRAKMAIADMPDFRDRGVPADLPREERKRRNYEMLVKNYYRTLLSVDDNVGRALALLDELDLGSSGMVDEGTMTKLGSLNGPEFDRLWLESMISHHQGAIGVELDDAQVGCFGGERIVGDLRAGARHAAEQRGNNRGMFVPASFPQQ